MSTYPEPTAFRHPFATNEHAPLSAVNYSSGFAQHPYKMQNNEMFRYGQSQSDGVPPVSHTNTFSFSANQQDAQAHPHINEVNHQPTLLGYGAQGSYSSLPSIPYPPGLMSHNAAPNLHQPSRQPPSRTGPVPFYTLPQTYVPPLPSNTQQSFDIRNQGPAQAQPELEDGEVNDTESNHPVTPSAQENMGSSLSRSSHGDHGEVKSLERKSPRRDDSDREAMSLHGPQSHDTYNGGTQILNNSVVETQPYSPFNQAQLPSGPHLGSFVSPSAANNSCVPLTQQTVLTKPDNGSVLGMTKLDAQRALLDLHSLGLYFDELVKAGLDPDALRTLSLETTTAIPRKQFQVVNNPTHEITQPEAWKRKSDEDQAASRSDPQPSLAESRTVSKPVKPAQGKLLSTKAADSKLIDRKEYIARMLAAKTGKPLPTTNTTDAPKAATSIEIEPKMDKNATADLVSHPVTVESTEKTFVEATPLAPEELRKDTADMEAIRKAQTDLARQKIEALRVRETKQHEARTVVNTDTEGQPETLRRTSTHNSDDKSDTVLQPSAPNRPNSYFSPVSQKPPFSIPGLFMTSGTSDQPLLSQKGESLLFPLRQDANDTSPTQVPSGAVGMGFLQPDGKSSTPSTSAQPPVPALLVDQGESFHLAVRETPEAIPRKRHKAADFIDSPSTRIKRPLGQQDHGAVIIEISEDEANDSEDDWMDIDVDHSLNCTPLENQMNNVQGGTWRSIGDQPPLSDVPSQKRSAVLKPASPQPPASQVREQKDLKSTEIEIEVMNRKIKELEQRIIAKKSNSRAQTPGFPSATTAPSPSGKPLLRNLDQQGSLTDSARPEDFKSHQNNIPTSSPPAADVLNIVSNEQDAGRRSVEIDIGEANAYPIRDEIGLLREAASDILHEEELEITLVKDSGGQSEDQLVNDLEERQHKAAHTPRASEDGAMRMAEVTQQLVLQEQQLVSQDIEQQKLLEEHQKLLDERQRSRKLEIESGLPLLDATEQKFRQRLESLRHEMEELTQSIQKVEADRNAWLEELQRLSEIEANEEPHEPVQPAIANNVELSSSSISPTAVDVDGSGSTQERRREIEEPADIEQRLSNASAAQTSHSPSQDSRRLFSDGELEGNPMDISQSDVDDGEITSLDQDLAIDEPVAVAVNDNEEMYEPPNEIGVLSPSKFDGRDRQSNDSVSISEDSISVAANEKTPAERQKSTSAEQRDILPGSPHDTDMQVDQQNLHHRPALDDTSDLDEYEPPEPSPFGEEASHQQAVSTIQDPDSEPTTLNEPGNAVAAGTSPVVLTTSNDLLPSPGNAERHENLAPQPIRPSGHFTPYESPLKQFKSFRYHPNFLSEVSSGFRSLTYSHAINPEIPICLYEIEGICNDSSCPNQHIAKMSLSDEKILVDLGTMPTGLSPKDAESFTNGLRTLIHDIRRRKVKDVNVVAGEIAGYRLQFLGDSTKILPL